MTHTFIARMRVFPEMEEKFIETCEQMELAVKKHEPNCLLYKFYRLREPHSFAVIESFVSEQKGGVEAASQQSSGDGDSLGLDISEIANILVTGTKTDKLLKGSS